MDGSVLFGIVSVVVVVLGAMITIIKREKIRNAGEIIKAGIWSLKESLSPDDDTPGKITPAEIGEIVEAVGKKAKEVLKDI
ncbi:hypothetical protein LCGC14_2763650 [marine sediment metagenome]|uniref:Uncharacterized protein n=1 Tax=marine sediment metagenome TaxID=412755 RepID=A0A0F8YYC2_9ZZZZ